MVESIGSYLHIVFQYDIPQLRDFLIVFSFRSKTESVRTDDAACVQDAVVADGTAVVDGHVRIDDAIITDRHPVADVGMWVNLTVFPDFNLLADVDERAYVTILFDGGRRRDTCRRVDSRLLSMRLFDHVQKGG